METGRGKTIIEAGANVWPHERRTAEALARAGFIVEFIAKANNAYEKTADVLMDGLIWEIKSPKSKHLKMVEQNIRRALKQSPNVIFDSQRMKDLPDSAIQHEVEKWAHEIRSVRRFLFVNKRRDVIDIK